jgi:tetratricopeptide (TPR) repeat protein
MNGEHPCMFIKLNFFLILSKLRLKTIPVLFIVFPLLVSSQNKQLDSLQKLTQKLSKQPGFKTDSIYLKSINEIIAIFLTNHPDSALELAKTNESLAHTANFGNIEAEAIRHQGFAQVILGNYSEAMVSYNKSLAIFTQLKNEKGQAKIYNNIAVVFKNIGDYPKALEFHYKSLEIKEKLKDKRGIAVSLGNIAILYKNQKRFKESFIEQLKAYQLFKEINDENGICTAAGNLAINYTYFKNYSKALFYHEEALKIAEKNDDHVGIAHNLDNISVVKFNQNKIQEAISLQYQSLAIREENKDLYGIARSYISLGDFYQALGNKDKAFNYYVKGLAISEKIGRRDLSSAFHQEMYKAHKEFGNLAKAIYHLEQHNNIEDSLFNDEVENKTLELKTKHEFEQKALQLKEEKEKERLTFITKSENQRYIIIIISLFIVFLLAFIISLQLSKMKVQLSYKMLEDANAEIKQKTEALHQSLIELSNQKNEINELNFSLQEKVKERTKNLESAYKQLRDFSYANSHHLRKPVANLLGLCDAISKNNTDDPENKEIIKMMLDSAIELDTIIHELNKLDIQDNL